MNTTSGFLIAVFLLVAVSASNSAWPESRSVFSPELKKSREPGKGNEGGGGFFGPGGSFSVPGFGRVPGFGNGVIGGYGGGYGGPSGGYSRGGIVRPTITCTDHGPCYKKKLTCPAKCFTSYSRSGKNYGEGGGGGGCTIDCKKKCVAFC